MFKLSADQVRALEGASESEFHARLVGFIAAEFDLEPDRFDELDAGLVKALEDARTFGLSRERSLSTYCLAAFMCGYEFKDDPKVRATLTSVFLSEGAKADWLGDWLEALETALEAPADVR